jgi:hypothetical protein
MLCGILSSLTVFIYLGHMSAMLNIEIESLPLSGPGIIILNLFFEKINFYRTYIYRLSYSK